MHTTLLRHLAGSGVLVLLATAAAAQGIGSTDGGTGGGSGGDGAGAVSLPPGGGGLPGDVVVGGGGGGSGGPAPRCTSSGPLAPGFLRVPGTLTAWTHPSSAPPAPSAPGQPGSSGHGAPIEWWNWWEHNRERFLDVRPNAGAGPWTPASQADAGRAERFRQVRDELLPELVEFVVAGDDLRVLRAALGAIGRVGPPEDTGLDARAVEALIARLSHPHAGVAESAVTALGAYGSPRAVLVLGALCADEDAGRDLVGSQRVPVRVRAFAAYGLGVAASGNASPELRRYAVHALTGLLASDVARYPDVQAAAVIALGLAPAPGRATDGEGPPAAGVAPQVGYLLEILRDERRPRMARIHAPTAIGRLSASGGLEPALRTEALEALLDALDRGEEVAVRRSAVVALGEIADADLDDIDRDVRLELIEHLRSGDLASRRFAAIALARIGARPGPETGLGDPLGGLEEVIAALVRGVSHGKQAERGWSALALGVLGHDLATIGELLPVEVPDLLIRELRGERNEREAAVIALALGLIGDGRAVDEVVVALERASQEEFRGLIAVGLGLLRQGAGLPALAEMTAEGLHRPLWMEAGGLARALIGDRNLAADLAASVAECDCSTSIAGTARALARTADPRAATSLLALALDESRPASVRAHAIGALGWLARRSDLPWDARLSIGLNYIDGPSSLTDPTGYGVLDTY